MDKFKSLADYLGTTPAVESDAPRLEDITDSKQFALAVLSSREFRRYIVDGLTLGELPAAIVTRLMDYAWGKPAERIEHSGRVENITEVRRVVIHVDERQVEEPEEVTEVKRILH